MRRFLKPIAVCFIFLIAGLHSSAQDSSEISGWKATAKKLADGKYELSFTVPALNGWQLYDPNINFEDFKTSELIFPDSSITQVGKFELTAPTKKIKTPLSEDSTFEVFENGTTFKATIQINGTIPANLRGIFTYTYGKGIDEFKPGNSFEFSAALEGGVDCKIRILVPSIDIENPVASFGDEIDKKSDYITIFLLGLLGGLIALLT
ncbi:MAG TPA: hypothetical protein PK421_04865, partial [Chitinophagaceae bacterium]|nr:hypothetical protein [Chitinophagaceae bacterium]